MSQPPAPSDGNADIAKSAGLAFLGRLGALVEIVGLPLFAWLYGAATLGIFFTLWSAVKLLTTFTECAMTTSLQRFQPRAQNENKKRQVIKIALMVGLTLSLLVSAILYVFADQAALIFNASSQDALMLPAIIQTYIWILPFWTLVEILTGSIRAERKFGPEIRIRIFYEQGLRIFAGIGFYYLGYHTFGLFFAHITSVIIACLLSLRLLSRYHSLKEILVERIEANIFREVLSFSIFMMPATMIKRAHSEIPILVLNLILPGIKGAEAAAIFGVGRKITSLLQVVRQSFEYVVAPFASHKLSKGSHDELEDMFAFSTRLIASIILPLGAFLIVVRYDIIQLFGFEFEVAAWIILILSLGRIIEALTGPSNAIIEMIGHKALPLLNGVAGISVLLGLQFLYTDELGVLAGAIGAAGGLVTTSLLAFLEALAFYNLNPYRPSGTFRPIGLAFILSLFIVQIVPLTHDYGHVISLLAGLLSFIVSLFIIIRFGFQDEDVKALGRLGGWFGKKEP